tara:strand:+ start:198 stop:377 length:180 start_codon:yes stop_codon:yes gene_type:complete
MKRTVKHSDQYILKDILEQTQAAEARTSKLSPKTNLLVIKNQKSKSSNISIEKDLHTIQ